MPDFLLGKHFVPSQADWILSTWNKKQCLHKPQSAPDSLSPRNWFSHVFSHVVSPYSNPFFNPCYSELIILWLTVIVRLLISLILITMSCVTLQRCKCCSFLSWWAGYLTTSVPQTFPSVTWLSKFFFHLCFPVQSFLAFKVFALWVVSDIRPISCTLGPSFPYVFQVLLQTPPLCP